MDARPDVLVKSARERIEAGDAYGAIHVLKELVERGEAFADAYNLLGLAYAMVGQRAEGLAAFEQALRLNPRYVDALLNRAVTLSDLGRSDDAVRAFTEAQSLGAVDHTGYSAPVASRLANLHAELAEAYVEAGGRAEAIRQLEAATALRPEFVDLRYRLARLYLDEGRPEPALRELERIVALRPAFTDAQIALGMACYLTKDLAGARRAWESARARAPEDPRVRAYLHLLERVGG